MAAIGLIRNNDAFPLDYEGLRNREGKPLRKMKAMGAVMNKLLRVVYALLKKGESFDPSMVCGKPLKEVALRAA